MVRELRSSDPDAAAAIAKLRKPPVSVWAIDQLAVEKPDVIIELLAAGADVRDAHLNVTSGKESREDLLVTSNGLRDRVEAAARAAAGVLEGAGHAASEETGRRIRATLQAAATGGAEDRRALWSGTMDRDLDAAGFGGLSEPEDDVAELAALLAPMRRPSAAKPRPPARTAASATQKRLDRRDAEREAANLDAAAERARASADSKRRQADRLAAEARFAADEASAGEDAAAAAELAARTAHVALEA